MCLKLPEWEDQLIEEAFKKFPGKPTPERGRWMRKEYRKRWLKGTIQEILKDLKK